MNTIEVNYLAILLAGLGAQLIGFLWYSPILFGNVWVKLKGYTPTEFKKEQAKMGKFFLATFILSLLTGIVLSHVITLTVAYLEQPLLMTGLMSAFQMWLAFIMPTQLSATIFGNKNFKLFAIDTGYQLVAILLMGFIIASL